MRRNAVKKSVSQKVQDEIDIIRIRKIMGIAVAVASVFYFFFKLLLP